MEIKDLITNSKVSNVSILLNTQEAKELIFGVQEILSRSIKGDHVHINSEDYMTEIIIAIEK